MTKYIHITAMYTIQRTPYSRFHAFFRWTSLPLYHIILNSPIGTTYWAKCVLYLYGGFNYVKAIAWIRQRETQANNFSIYYLCNRFGHGVVWPATLSRPSIIHSTVIPYNISRRMKNAINILLSFVFVSNVGIFIIFHSHWITFEWCVCFSWILTVNSASLFNARHRCNEANEEKWLVLLVCNILNGIEFDVKTTTNWAPFYRKLVSFSIAHSRQNINFE